MELETNPFKMEDKEKASKLAAAKINADTNADSTMPSKTISPASRYRVQVCSGKQFLIVSAILVGYIAKDHFSFSNWIYPKTGRKSAAGL